MAGRRRGRITRADGVGKRHGRLPRQLTAGSRGWSDNSRQAGVATQGGEGSHRQPAQAIVARTFLGCTPVAPALLCIGPTYSQRDKLIDDEDSDDDDDDDDSDSVTLEFFSSYNP